MLPTFDLPDDLATTYGGSLGFTEPRLYANFVASLDGVVGDSRRAPVEPADLRGKRGRPVCHGTPARVRRRRARRRRDAARLASDALDGRAGLSAGRRAVRRAAPLARPPASADARRAQRQRLGRPAASRTQGARARSDERAGRSAARPPSSPLRRRSSRSAARARSSRSPPSRPCERGSRADPLRGGTDRPRRACRDGLVDELFLTTSPLLAGRGVAS